MPNRKYNRGSAFERRIKRELEDADHYVVRSAGSRGAVDLMAVDCVGRPYFVQCKKDGRITKAEWSKLFEVGKSHNTTTLLVSKPKRNEPVMYEYVYIAVGKDRIPDDWEQA